MARIRTNFIRGYVENNPLLIGGTTLTSAALASLPAISSPDIAIIVLDPESISGAPEIVYITAHSSSATTATISRGQESTSARQHASGTRWIHAPVKLDWDHGNLDGLADDDHTIYVKVDGTRNMTGGQTIDRTNLTDKALDVKITTDTQPRLRILASGEAQWGGGAALGYDTNLYRSAANTLKTDDELSVGSGTIYIGADCTFSRASANVLQTGGSLTVNGTSTSSTSIVSSSTSSTQSIRVKVSAEAQDRLIVTADGAMTWGSGSASGDTNLYRSAANTLKTDDTFVTARLDVGTNTYAFVPIGSVMPFAGSTAPDGWLLCFGQAVPISTYAGLFAVVGTTYGVGDSSTTFNLPDLRGRVVAGRDNMGGSAANRLTSTSISPNANTLGATGGSQTVTLAEANIPRHAHSIAHSHTASDAGHTHGMYGGAWCNGSSYHVLNDNYVSSGNYPHYFDLAYATQTGFASISVSGSTVANSGNWGTLSPTAVNTVEPTIIMNYIIKF